MMVVLFIIRDLLFLCSILVDNCDPFGEDLWDEIKINDLVFQGVRLCSRCKVNIKNMM